MKRKILFSALSLLLGMDVGAIETLIAEQYRGKEKLLDANVRALHLGRDHAAGHLEPIGLQVRAADNVGERIFIDGNSAAEVVGDAPQGEERRERRSRDRYGRDRRDRNGERRDERAAELPGSVSDAGSVAQAAPQTGADAPAPRSYFARSAAAGDAQAPAAVAEANVAPAPTPPAPPARASVASPAPAAAHGHAAAPAAGLPKVTPFALPLGDLESLAQSAGLQWVNSDADKVASVQAAIAAEPQPIRVPRERPPLVEIDDGPLVLVETQGPA